MRPRHSTPRTQTLMRTAHLLLQVLIACVLCSALLFPHLHVVYPTAHDAHTCPVYLAVIVGAVISVAAFVLMAAFCVMGRSCCFEPAHPTSQVRVPWDSRAPPV